MAKDRPPSFPFYPANWFADTRHMTRDQRCRYLEAMGESWLAGCYGVGTEDQWRRWLGYRPRAWAKVRVMFAERFKVEGDLWVQKKLLEVRAEQLTYQRSGRLGGVARMKALDEAARTLMAQVAAKSRWDAKRMPSECVADASSASASASAVETKNSAAAAAPADQPVNPTAGDVRALVRGLATGMRMPGEEPPKKKAPPVESAWEWLKANATPEAAAEQMRFAGWLVKTGTRDGDVVLALVKHRLVHNPRSAHAYYTPEGNARQSIAMRAASDAAIAQHEQIKREEREFLGKRR